MVVANGDEYTLCAVVSEETRLTTVALLHLESTSVLVYLVSDQACTHLQVETGVHCVEVSCMYMYML